jgi:adenylate kinase family enzyme
VIWLDYNRFVCLTGWIKRVITNWGKARPDMADGCAEWFDPEFAGWIWRFNKEKRRGYEKLLSAQEDKVIYRFKSRHQLRKFIKTL